MPLPPPPPMPPLVTPNTPLSAPAYLSIGLGLLVLFGLVFVMFVLEYGEHLRSHDRAWCQERGSHNVEACVNALESYRR